MTNLFKALDGNKTYLVAIIYAVAYFLLQIDGITQEQFEFIKNLDLAGGVIAARSAIKKLEISSATGVPLTDSEGNPVVE